MTAYFQNAQSLFDEVLILPKAARIPRACALCILGLEELAKIPLLHKTLQTLKLALIETHGVNIGKGAESTKPSKR
jgi:AbiV family abortive infection protein